MSTPFYSFSIQTVEEALDNTKNIPGTQSPLFDNEDFGDAPELPINGYPTTLLNNGARHTIVAGIFLGNFVDQEPDGQPGTGADCDDTDCLFPSFGDDEDGVILPASVTQGSTVDISVTASVSGYLDAWFDFNLVNGWNDTGEHIFTSTPVNAGANTLSIVVPINAVPGQSYVRFRFRDFSAPIGFDGLVQNGEVEDYAVTITENTNGNLDFGDAPSIYPTLLANNGARHTLAPGIFLGIQVDPEPDGQPNTNADCDDSDCLFISMGDDEDGVTMPAGIVQGTNVTITVSASVNGYLDAWMDFNLINGWADAGEHIFTSEPLTAGTNTISFYVPIDAEIGQSFARFRFRDFNDPISFDGPVQNGEVEDYTVNIEAPQPVFDFGDAPEDPSGEYPTTLLFDGARHTLTPGIYLGSSVDAEPDGQPGTGADCDDTDCLFPSSGDDEDGVSLPAGLAPGSTNFMTVTASVNGYLDVWMDYNGNNSWADAGEHFITNAPMAAGPNTLLFFVPVDAVPGQSYMRFRFRDYSGPLSYNGPAQNGEVEDYSIMIESASTENLDFGDAPQNPSGNYPTILANNGARHTIVPGIYLGNQVDPEPDGQPGTGANCDDNDCYFSSSGDDEDGVIMSPWITKGTTSLLIVSASVDGYLDAWIDFNRNESWTDTGEHIFTNEPLLTGPNYISFNVPAGADTGLTYVRFRFRDFNDPVSFDGLVQNGEVEDYAVSIVESQPEIDFGDAPENPAGEYPTTLASDGARHVIVPGIYLGSFADGEPEGQPNITADCDDSDCLFPSFGDDEDGIVLPSSISPNSIVNITVTASVDGYLDAWVDFNQNNNWIDSGEHIFNITPLSAGINTITFNVPSNAELGQTFARFRFRDYDSPLNFEGLALNGEVEDYVILISQTKVILDINIILGGGVSKDWTPGQPSIMDTLLNTFDYLPLTQPYNNVTAIWHHSGTESVITIPRSDIVDWILLELRETTGGPETATSSTSVGKKAAFLLSTGEVVAIDGSNLPEFDISVNNNLFIVVWHRNHLGVLSANPLNFNGIDTWSYDFTTTSGQAYGGTNALTEIAPGYFGMLPGDALPDGQIDQLDKNNAWDLQAGKSGYFPGDFNLNTQVNNSDKNDHWIPNMGKGTSIP